MGADEQSLLSFVPAESAQGRVMKRWRLSAFGVDQRVAKVIARNSSPQLERPLQFLTRVADEHFLLPAVSIYWLASRRDPRSRRRAANHLLLTIATTAVLPHLLKRIIAQERPDRVEIRGDRHGVPRSGKAFDAFPSGHAVHMGALGAALSRMAPRHRLLIWSVATSLALTRVTLLAHWLSDVVVGGALGIATESLAHTFDRKPKA